MDYSNSTVTVPTSKKRSIEQLFNDQEQKETLQCCSGIVSSRPIKSVKTQEKQSISPCTIHSEKYNKAVDLMESGSVLQAIHVLKSFLAQNLAAVDKFGLNPSLHNILIKASIKLATAYQMLSLPKEAILTLDQIFLPNQVLHISYGHNLFGELATIYLSAKDELTKNRILKIPSDAEFGTLYMASCLSCLGRECVELGKHSRAVMLFQASVHKIQKYSNDLEFSSYFLKQLYIQANLDLTRCHLSLGSLSSAMATLNTLQTAEQSLDLTYSNPKFLETVTMKATMDSWNSSDRIRQSFFEDIPGTYNCTITRFTECCYQVLCVPPNASIEAIQSSFRHLSIILHPDKGGDTSLMQRLLWAHGTLKDDGRRKSYNGYCQVTHPNFYNQMISMEEEGEGLYASYQEAGIR
ncbi:hypothetical protein MJO28_004690 [Puccinia striiformis f. sp. tritici]|uniref:Uncharacterized protein n=1 Tax=Puccinia striiformis f. sp. tritici TaxID=168172 RepID=A0ACC0ER82_9BASI|nr:hypothetical protein MJO28_004690 [Puccinia striiformis f. sp. tritici]